MFVFVISISFGILIKNIAIPEAWNGQFRAFFADFLGIAYLFNQTSANDTWWYISLTYLLYLFFPFLYAVCKKSILLFLAVLLSLNFSPFYLQSPVNLRMISGNILSFGVGILFANYDIFRIFPRKVGINLVTALLLFFSSLCIYRINTMLGYTFLSFAIVFTGFTLIGKISWLKKFLSIIGKHSSTGYLIHNFIL